MTATLADALRLELVDLERGARRRSCPALSGHSRISVLFDGRPAVSFCSNDYLGLAEHPALARAATASTLRSGFGAAGSRLVGGDLPEHRSLEAALARLVDLPAALLFSTGYQANLGALAALAGPSDLVVSDASNHASLIDGCRLSRARIAVYRHGDAADAARRLATPGQFRRRFLVTESLFSMDGDEAPLAALAHAARAAGAYIFVDEAHALGILGPAGRGLCAAARIIPDVLVGTLGKALGSFGGFVAGTEILRDTLVNRARSFLFTTAPPPAVAAAAEAAVLLALGSEGDARRVRLAAHVDRLRTLLGHPPSRSPILPLVLGPDLAALEASAALLARGLFVQAIRPPTVPEAGARLRVTLSAAHEAADVEALGAALRALVPAVIPEVPR